MEFLRARRPVRQSALTKIVSHPAASRLAHGFRALSGNDAAFAIVLMLLVLTIYRCYLFPPQQRLLADAAGILGRPTSCEERLDVVYTWVNGTDPAFQEAVRHFSDSKKDRRYRDHDELRFSMRSLEKYMPWVGQVYLVTNGQVPTWLDTSKVRVIRHEEFFKNKADLPTFASPAIESQLCNIKGLSKRFIYFNDDIFLGAPVYPEDFITPRGIQKVYLSWDMPDCAPQCAESFIGDKYCDVQCNNSACNWDGGDCIAKPGDRIMTNSLFTAEMEKDDYATGTQDKGDPDITIENERRISTCAQACSVTWIGDGICDAACRNKFCAYDAGDCKNEGLLPRFPLASFSQPVIVARPVDSDPNWFSFLIDLGSVLPNHTRVVSVESDRPQYIRAAAFVERWNAVAIVSTLRALDKLYSNQSTPLPAKITLQVEFDKEAEPTMSQLIPDPNAIVVNVDGKKEAEVDFTIKIKRIPLANVSTSLPIKIASEDDFEDVQDDDVDEDYASKVLSANSEDDDAKQDSYGLASKKKKQKSRKNKQSHSDDDEDEEEDEESDTDQPPEPDLFSQSLLFTKRILKEYFENKITINHKVPAHMPHLIDRDVFQRLFGALESHFKKTASHKFRQPDDVQFSYAYFSYLMAESELPLPEAVVWSFVDSNANGCLNANEFRTLMAYVLSEDTSYATKPPTPFSKESFENDDSFDFDTDKLPKIDTKLLLRAHDAIWAEAKADSLVPILDSCLSLNVLKRAQRAYTALERAVVKMYRRTRPTFEIFDSSPHVTFAQLRDKPSDVLRTLDEIRARPTKFVCINDDTTSQQEEKHAAMVDRSLKNFLEMWFPKPSKYELQGSAPQVPHLQEERIHGIEDLHHTFALIFGFGILLLTIAIIILRKTGFGIGPLEKPHGV